MITHSFFLWFLLTLILVLLLHLIRFRREKKMNWAAMEFLMAAVRTAKKRSLPVHWLIVLLRLLLVTGIVLLFAEVRPESFLSFFGRNSFHRHYLVFLDDTYSTGQSDGTITIFLKEKEILLNHPMFASEGKYTLTLVTASSMISGTRTPLLSAAALDNSSREHIRQQISELNFSEYSTVLSDLLPVLEKSIINSSNPQIDEILILSDSRRRDWNASVSLNSFLDRMKEKSIRTTFFPVVFPLDNNVVLDKVHLLPAILSTGVPVPFEITLVNKGSSTATGLTLQMSVDGQVFDQQKVEPLEPNSEIVLTLYSTFAKPGTKRIIFELSQDSLPIDNRFYMVLNVPLYKRAMMIGSSLSGDIISNSNKNNNNEEAVLHKIISTALIPDMRTGLEIVYGTQSSLTEESLKDIELVLLTGGQKINDNHLSVLNQFVRNGGSLCYFPTATTTLSDFENILFQKENGLLPINATTILNTNEGTSLILKEKTLCQAMKIFLENEQLLALLQMKRINLAEKDEEQMIDNAETQILAAEESGHPVLTITRKGKGRVAQWGTSPHPDWSNLAANPGFPVCMLELVAFLMERPIIVNKVGKRLSFTLNKKENRQRVPLLFYDINKANPADNSALSEVQTIDIDRDDNQITASVKGVPLSGFYCVPEKIGFLNENNKSTLSSDSQRSGDLSDNLTPDLPGFWQAVNISTEESDLTPLTTNELHSLFTSRGVSVLLDNESNLTLPGLWNRTNALSALLFLFLLELFLANSFYTTPLWNPKGGKK